MRSLHKNSPQIITSGMLKKLVNAEVFNQLVKYNMYANCLRIVGYFIATKCMWRYAIIFLKTPLTLNTKGIISMTMANSILGWFLTGRRINLRTSSQKSSCTTNVMVAFSTMTAQRYKMHWPIHALHCGGFPGKETQQ